MSIIREILRLALDKRLPNREIGRSLGVSHTVVNNYTHLAAVRGLIWSEIRNLSEEELKKALKPGGNPPLRGDRPQPEWSVVHQELKRKGVTLQLLWQEYKAVYPEGYQLSQFYEHYSRWKGKLSLSMRQTHKAGEKTFVDYAGQTVPVVDRITGQVREAQIFVAVLGASSYTYAEATWTQGVEDWISSHVRSFEYFRGVSEVVVPDNLLSGVSRACRYEPGLNRSYREMADHYGVAIIPARVRKPKDKAKVEVGVQVVERWILAALRKRTFFSLSELNEAIRELLDHLNRRPFKKMEGSRLSCFETVEKGALKPLPQTRYVVARWKKARVNIDYHVELEGHYYSVPFSLVREEVELRFTSSTVEAFHRGKRVASHQRSPYKGSHTTVSDHMPKSHRQYQQWSPSRIINWAATMGDSTAEMVRTILESRKHPEQGYRSCLGLLRLSKQYSPQRLEKACERAVAIGAFRYKSVRSILEKGLDREPLPETSPLNRTTTRHTNIRGGEYYTETTH